MKRWNNEKKMEVENNRIDLFLADILEVCDKHKLAISHEDGHGAFEIEEINIHALNHLFNANDKTGDEL